MSIDWSNFVPGSFRNDGKTSLVLHEFRSFKTCVMKEFMLLIRNEIDHQSTWSPAQHQQFLKACEVYINELKAKRKLIAAQPMIREGKTISGFKGHFKEANFTESKEVIVGYYHLLANDIDEAISIAKQNPEFEYSTTARSEVRPIKMKEEKTRYIYPTT